MRALLVSPLGFIIGLTLGALGGGGSILAVPVLVYLAGQGARAATTTSLVVVGVAAISGLVGHSRGGRVRWRTGITFGLVGIGGSLVGSALNRSISPDTLLVGFAGLMVVAAVRMWTTKPAESNDDEAGSGRWVKILLAGSAVGLLTGLFGVGGGFVIVPALVLLLGYSMPTAVGTSLLIIAINAAVALSSRLAVGGIEWGVTLPFAVAAAAGSLAGNKVAERIPAARLTRWFAALLIGVAFYTLARSVPNVV